MEFNKMIMKKCLLMVIICCSVSCVQAQTFNEWFKQKKTQIQYLVDQIAALKVYSESLEKGYKITNGGLKFIHGIKEGDFDLHEMYFNSLKKVNAQVKSYSKIADIILKQTAILKACKKQKNLMRERLEFSDEELNYSDKVFENLLDGCGEIIDQLTAVLSDGIFEMKDGERIEIIDQLYDQMEERYAFLQNFGDETYILSIQRMKDRNDVKTLRDGFGIY
jgi:hypothetical protein